MLLTYCQECETSSCVGLDRQLLHQTNLTRKGLLVKIDDMPNMVLGKSVHPWVQSGMRKCLEEFVSKYPTTKLYINSAYRTIVGQALLFEHGKHKRCGIDVVSPPGKSNHNNASSIDLENWEEVIDEMESCGFSWLGRRIPRDKMHFDCVRNCLDMRSISVQAFQQLHNLANPNDKLAIDGDYGPLVASRLKIAPVEGYPGLPDDYPSRVMRFTEPLQAGNDVGKLQLDLRAAGVALEKADKIFGVSTQAAVREYQTKNGMFADGVAGKSTLLALTNGVSKDIA